MPLLARMITAPLVVDVRRGALAELGTILADRRISTSGRVAIAVGSTYGPTVQKAFEGGLAGADWYSVEGGTINAAVRLVEQVRTKRYDAIVGVGGGTVLDVTKFAAARLGLPMVAVATNLAHDGIASPISTLDNDAGRGSYGVPAPLAVLVDLDLIDQAPERSIRSGIGEILSNLSAIADWEAANRQHGEEIDGLAVSLARTAAQAVLNHPGTVADDDFLVTLAEGLVLSGISMVVAGTSRPSSGACHEISHSIDLLHPQRRGYHGEQVGLGAAFAWFLRGDLDRFHATVDCLQRHALPVRPSDLGFTLEEFNGIVEYAPQTRPGRITILEESGLTPSRISEQVAAFNDHVQARISSSDGAVTPEGVVLD
ncbi:iron-containing alcohol dehydrogenase family protein [Kribbella qitaiheensis]|uniref:Iron-containing alcohol dehydrogenase family protein n=1 Tax=Kribbella qitaiheensis TaxID=1544730 RepID=A0A7G6X3X9_9ACTN|nr:iron-containing alcohol dehydrogenase family protein [Kribbella qitaiheensis]QNE20944.1 iron-containing alcohol dehydrogenase family protein [Kribbella qitaiheensis]